MLEIRARVCPVLLACVAAHTRDDARAMAWLTAVLIMHADDGCEACTETLRQYGRTVAGERARAS